MVFPGHRVEIYVDDAWEDITEYALVREPITITRGTTEWATQAERATCDLVLDNTNGRFSPRNPLGPYYGRIGRNTQLRVRVGDTIRFVGEVPEWPPRWDAAGTDEWMPIQAAGILRRLGTGARPLRSALFRAINRAQPNFLAYWPLEDPPTSRQAGTPYGGQESMRVVGPAKFTGEPAGGTAGGFTVEKPGGRLYGNVRGCPDQWSLSVVYDVPEDTTNSCVPDVQWTTPGDALCKYWRLRINASGQPNLTVLAEDWSLSLNITLTSNIRGRGPVHLRVTCNRTGSGDLRTVLHLGQEESSGGWTFTGAVPRPISSVRIDTDEWHPDLTRTGAVSHLLIAGYNRDNEISNFWWAATGYRYETAADRIERLCGEENIPVQIIGDASESSALGPQPVATLLDIIGDAAEVDGGVIYETRDELGLSYRTRVAQHNTTPAAVVRYSETSPPMEPVDDDRYLRNDVTVTRDGGAAARVVRESGPLSILPPPDGVGRYEEGVTLNLADDREIIDQAGWRVHLGTWDEIRIPRVRINLARFTDLVEDVAALDVRSHLRLSEMPVTVTHDEIDLLVLGYTEVLAPYEWRIDLNCVPQGPWNVGVLDALDWVRLDTEGSELADPVTSTATSLTVVTTAGPRWTTDPAEMPIDIVVGGELMRVTAVDGTSSTQTFTVQRGVNGVVKSHAAGTPVVLARPLVLSF